MRHTTRRTLLAALPPVVAVLPAVVLLGTAGDRLPDPLPVHFGPAGLADGVASRGVAVVTDLAVAALLAVVFGGIARSTGRTPGPSAGTGVRASWVVAGSWAVAGSVGPVLLGAAAAGLDRATAAGAVLPGWTLPAALAGGVLGGLLGRRLAPADPVAVDEPAAPELRLGPTERAGWSRTVVSRLVLGGGAATGLGGLAALALGTTGTAVPLLVASPVLLALSSARVVVDRRGLVVELGPFGRPRIRIPASDVVSATATDISPLQFGGWGYRIVPGGQGVVLRAGRALVVTRRSGRRFTVTVDDADTAARLLAGMAGAARC